MSQHNRSCHSLSRRRLLLGSAAVAGALVTPFSLDAQTQDRPVAPVLENGAGFYRVAVGSIEVILLSDGAFPFGDPFPLFGANVNRQAVETTLTDQFVDPADAVGHVNALLIRTGRHTVLVDAGAGALFGPTAGRLRARLDALEVAEESIDTVVLTHAHPDHFGGLLSDDGRFPFPNAQLAVSPVEHDFWTGDNPDLSRMGVPEEMKRQIAAGARAILTASRDRLLMAAGGREIIPGVTAVAAPGHTPGHQALRISDGDDTLLFVSDLVHHWAIGFREPDFHVAFDYDSVEAVRTRRSLLDMVVDERLLIAGSHLPFPGFGHVARRGMGYQYFPVDWRW